MDQVAEVKQELSDPVDLTIVEEIASGRPAGEVAAMLGINLADMQTKVVSLRTSIQQRGRALRAERVEETYAQTEEKILQRIKKEAGDDLAEVGPLIRALEVIAKNRISYRNPMGFGAPNGPTSVHNTLINVTLPAAAAMAPAVTLNSHSEIIAVGNRNMAALPIEGVQRIFESMDKQARSATHEQEHSSHATAHASA